MVFVQFLIRSSEFILFLIGMGYLLGGLLVKTEFTSLKFYKYRSDSLSVEFITDNIVKTYSPLIKITKYNNIFRTSLLGKKYEIQL